MDYLNLVPVTVLLLSVMVCFLSYLRYKYIKSHSTKFFKKSQSFEDSIQRFNLMSDRAKATFMHRFCSNLDENQLMLMRKYVEKHVDQMSNSN